MNAAGRKGSGAGTHGRASPARKPAGSATAETTLQSLGIHERQTTRDTQELDACLSECDAPRRNRERHNVSKSTTQNSMLASATALTKAAPKKPHSSLVLYIAITAAKHNWKQHRQGSKSHKCESQVTSTSQDPSKFYSDKKSW